MPQAPDVAPATVRHINKNHVTISPAKGYDVVIWNISADNLEAIVAAQDGSETVRLRLEPPGPGREVAIKKHEPTGIVDIKYGDKK